jgi:hypothetical protein
MFVIVIVVVVLLLANSSHVTPERELNFEWLDERLSALWKAGSLSLHVRHGLPPWRSSPRTTGSR